MADLAAVDRMYTWSMEWFEERFVSSMKAAPEAADLEERLANLSDALSLTFYRSVCRSIFARHHTLFSLTLTARVLLSEGRIDGAEWTFLLHGGGGVAAGALAGGGAAGGSGGAVAAAAGGAAAPSLDLAWLDGKAWTELVALSELPAFSGLLGSLARQPDEWRAWLDLDTPHTAPSPLQLAALTPQPADAPAEASLAANESLPGSGVQATLHRLLLLRCAQLDKCLPAVAAFVTDGLGTKFVDPPPFSVEASWEESTARTPIIFVLSAGADPAAALRHFAAAKGLDGSLHSISLGEGQGPSAERLVRDAQNGSGGWVVLQNCHLYPSWMADLERLVESVAATEKLPPHFRMWLTTAPASSFPVAVLRRSIKLTNEPPRGLRTNVLVNLPWTAGLAGISDGEVDAASLPPEARAYRLALRACHYGLVLCHAITQERRKFGPLGWNQHYTFNATDLAISARQLGHYLRLAEETQGAIPFDALHYCTCELNYGGRISDEADRRLCAALLSDFYTPAILDHPPKSPFAPSVPAAYTPPPPDASLNDLVERVRKFPLTDPSEVFGLHGNATLAVARREAGTLFASAASIHSRGNGGSAAALRDRMELAARIATDLEEALPPTFDLVAAREAYPYTYRECFHTVLVQVRGLAPPCLAPPAPRMHALPAASCVRPRDRDLAHTERVSLWPGGARPREILISEIESLAGRGAPSSALAAFARLACSPHPILAGASLRRSCSGTTRSPRPSAPTSLICTARSEGTWR